MSKRVEKKTATQTRISSHKTTALNGIVPVVGGDLSYLYQALLFYPI